MKHILQYVTLFSALLLIIVILLQNQGGSLGAGFGGESSFYRSKRGAERVLFVVTIVLAVVFVGSIIGALFIKT